METKTEVTQAAVATETAQATTTVQTEQVTAQVGEGETDVAAEPVATAEVAEAPAAEKESVDDVVTPVTGLVGALLLGLLALAVRRLRKK